MLLGESSTPTRRQQALVVQSLIVILTCYGSTLSGDEAPQTFDAEAAILSK